MFSPQQVDRQTIQRICYSALQPLKYLRTLVYAGTGLVCLAFLVSCMPATPSTFPTPQQQQMPSPSAPQSSSSSPSQQPPSGSSSPSSSPSQSNPGSSNPLPIPSSTGAPSIPSLPSPSSSTGNPSLPSLPTLPSPTGPEDPNNGDPQNGQQPNAAGGDLPPADGEEGSEEDGTEGEGTGDQEANAETESNERGNEQGTPGGPLMEMPEDSGGWEVSNQTPLMGPGQEEEELEEEGDGTADTEDGQAVDEDFQQALEELDGEIMQERNEVIGRSHETVASQSGSHGIATVDDSGAANVEVASTENKPGNTPETQADEGVMSGQETEEVDIDRVIDTPDATDKDVIARQMREAALAEKDPELKKKLWEEYETYKKGL